MGKKIIMSVVSDLVTDQRVHRSASTLQAIGYEVLLVGRQKKDSLPMDPRPYNVKRFKLPFEKGFLFYASYNIRLFIFLLFNKADILHANDLDTLLPNVLIAQWRKIPLVYDSHEYFTGVPEIQERPLVKSTWEKVEKYCIPHVSSMYTVNKSIADLYTAQYKIPVGIVRNIPPFVPVPPTNRTAMGLPTDKFIIIIQGSGINRDRGAEEAVAAMQWVEGALLLIVGSGDVLGELKELVINQRLTEKVYFVGKVPYAELKKYTACSDLGLAVDKNTNINYQFSLPNKLFDYINAQVPILASRLTEIERIIKENHIGTFIESHDPQHIASKINEIIQDKSTYLTWKQNLQQIEGKYTWEKEQEEVLKQYGKLT